MPGSVILACEMIEDEVRLALEGIAPEARPPLVWIESGLHDRPERLKAALSALIDKLDRGAEEGKPVTLPSVRPGRGPAVARREEVTVGPVEEVVLALGFCGNALTGLGARHLALVFPRVDDCISMLLSCGHRREEIPRDPRTYYLTRGWFSHESSLLEAFEDWEKRLGPEKARALQAAMFGGYKKVNLIDTRAYDLEECLPQSKQLANQLRLDLGIVTGSVQLLEKLFRGERDSEIVVVRPGQTIGFDHLVTTQCAEGGK